MSGRANSIGISELDRVYACPKNADGEDDVYSCDIDFGESCDTGKCGECIWMCVDASPSSGGTKVCDCDRAAMAGEARRFRYPFSVVRERGKNTYI